MVLKILFLSRYAAAAALSILACACSSDINRLALIQENGPPVAAGFAETAFPAEDRLNRIAKQGFERPSVAPEPVESGIVPVKLVKKGAPIQTEPPLTPLRHMKTKLVAFENGPFPFHGTYPGSGRTFFDVNENGRRGHRTFNGSVYWEDKTYSDPRTLLHIPKGFDLRRPALMVFFLHGHGATLQRDVIDRQRVPEQVSEAGVNAVLVAPQLASDAAELEARQIVGAGRLRALSGRSKPRAGQASRRCARQAGVRRHAHRDRGL